MTKELVISANRHETRVAILEDDQVVEVYHQRENEYSLAGSIHKGRVTRVLPGMQSAFVDIGLERDAFLYVSDFFEDNEEYDKIVTSVEDTVLKLERGPQQGAAVPAPRLIVANLAKWSPRPRRPALRPSRRCRRRRRWLARLRAGSARPLMNSAPTATMIAGDGAAGGGVDRRVDTVCPTRNSTLRGAVRNPPWFEPNPRRKRSSRRCARAVSDPAGGGGFPGPAGRIAGQVHRAFGSR